MVLSAIVKNYFMSWKMGRSIQRGVAELNGLAFYANRVTLYEMFNNNNNGTFHFSTNEIVFNHCTNENHSLFVLYNAF